VVAAKLKLLVGDPRILLGGPVTALKTEDVAWLDEGTINPILGTDVEGKIEMLAWLVGRLLLDDTAELEADDTAVEIGAPDAIVVNPARLVEMTRLLDEIDGETSVINVLGKVETAGTELI
jgi:hypothetical protein